MVSVATVTIRCYHSVCINPRSSRKHRATDFTAEQRRRVCCINWVPLWLRQGYSGSDTVAASSMASSPSYQHIISEIFNPPRSIHLRHSGNAFTCHRWSRNIFQRRVNTFTTSNIPPLDHTDTNGSSTSSVKVKANRDENINTANNVASITPAITTKNCYDSAMMGPPIESDPDSNEFVTYPTNNNNNYNSNNQQTSIISKLSHQMIPSAALQSSTHGTVNQANHRPIEHTHSPYQHRLDVNEGEYAPVVTSTTGNNARTNINAILQTIQRLCHEEIYPIGSIVTSSIVMDNVKRVLNVFAASYSPGSNVTVSSNLNDYSTRHNPTDHADTNVDAVDEQHVFNEAISALLQLLVRLSREPSSHLTTRLDPSLSGGTELLSSLPIEYYNSILSKWKDAAILLAQQQEENNGTNNVYNSHMNSHNTVVWSATLMAQFLIEHGLSDMIKSSSSSQVVSSSTSSTFRFIKYNIYTICLVLHVALQQSPARLAPHVIESIWEQFKLNQCTVKSNESIVYCYNILLQSYINSGQKDLAIKIETIWTEMQSRNIPPNMASYHLRLKYYREQKKLREMESFINVAATATANTANNGESNATSNKITGNVWQQPHELALPCWHEVLHSYMNAAMEKRTIEQNNCLFYIHKGQTILQQTIIPQWFRQQNPNDADKAEIYKCIQLVIATYRNVLQRPQYKFDLQDQSNLKSNPLQLSVQQRIINNNPKTYREQQIRDRIFESAESFYQFIHRQQLKDISFSEYTSFPKKHIKIPSRK